MLGAVTITVYVDPSDPSILIYLLEVLEKLNSLEKVDTQCEIDPSKLRYSEFEMKGWIKVNIPSDLYLKFKRCH